MTYLISEEMTKVRAESAMHRELLLTGKVKRDVEDTVAILIAIILGFIYTVAFTATRFEQYAFVITMACDMRLWSTIKKGQSR